MVGVFYLIIVIYNLYGFVDSAENCPTICTCLGNYVDCSQKNLPLVPLNIPNWTSQLNLNSNRIRILKKDALEHLTKLSELKLNKNKINVIAKEVFDNQKRLKNLELNHNHIKDIEALTFKNLEQLTSLRLKRNKISQLKDGAFFGLKKIKSLMLDYNFIQIISKTWLYDLDNLKELTISNNIINHIENDAWEFCKGLTELDLSFNRIKAIKKDSFNNLYILEKLNLNNNNISFIEEEAFEQVPNLKVLQLSHNKLSWTIEDGNGVYRNLINLDRLSLASNDVKDINANAFFGLKNIVFLDLNNNNITSIQKNAFSDVLLLQELRINTSSLLCDCNLEWFKGWLEESKHLKESSFEIRTECIYPEPFRGLPLKKVPEGNFTCDELPKPRLKEEPDVEIMALKGENISLSCKAMSSSSDPMVFTWKKNNVEIINGIIEIVSNTVDKNTETTSTLTIPRVQHLDAGKYQCVVSNKFGRTYSQKSTISVLIFPTFVKIPHNVTVSAGATAKLECSASGEPSPEIAWQKDGGNDFPAARERRMHVMTTDDVFFIVNAKPNDMGIYSCMAHNPAGTIVANATLVIEEMPSFVKPMENKETAAGESVVLKCMASGAPKPTIQWLKDGVPIRATDRYFLTAEDQLMIIIDTIPSDAGTYQCRLNNSLGVKVGYSELHIKPSLMSSSDMVGIVIITVVCCVVVTSVIWVIIIIYQTRKRINFNKTNSNQPDHGVIEFPDKNPPHFGDNASEHSSCKDSGVEESAKRSSDDLLPEGDFALIIEESNGEKVNPSRTASLSYVAADGNTCHTPLLLKDTPSSSYTRSTNHDRCKDETTPEISVCTEEDESQRCQ
ncbi:leucine-rich repeats and immunoglobulin-like domains protein 3 isoform X2 [Agrilus planipennis]|uniref:Leucine-rich repeats and immunoglobulin-like domains protein 3 isoform X2 n=1 Tax=Agrilus planipennis TaxID=224129 RepID=A0A1W4X000_AGRPL|nr:leucine-rich repeats and immunoglobulin-like domains protein 3 isoform X2 [Agrilus planipennis]